MVEQSTEGLTRLIEKLDALGGPPSLVELGDALSESRLGLVDVSPYIQPNPRNYNRGLVVRRQHYELLVMTWLAGQASVPHDHAGSICIMQVMQGTAIEGAYRVAGDGFVDLEYESPVKCGQITAGQDAGVHTVRNAGSAGEVLVTVHVYALPLRDYRQFVERPRSMPPGPLPDAEAPTVVVVGGGFSGSMAAAQALRGAAAEKRPVRVVVVERRGAIGEGVAYGTRSPSHLLNVPAGKMSAWPDRPDDFVRWASARYGDVQSGDFLCRQWYGQYIRETLLDTAGTSRPWGMLSVMFDEVRRVARHPAGGWLVHLGAGASIRAAAVIIAIGHRAPSDPIGRNWTGPRNRFIADPWKPFSLNAIAPEDPVAILGSGLTAVDTILALARHTRAAPITFLSRRGLLPQAHASVSPVDMSALVIEAAEQPGGATALELFRGVRRAVRESLALGKDWRGVIDGLRPHARALWQAMPTSQRRRFLSRLRPFWEVHRHRMPAAAAEQIQGMLQRGELRVIAGRVASARAEAQSVQLSIAPRAAADPIALEVGWVINCTGPMPDNSATSNPAIGSLLIDGWLCADELRLGIQTTSEGIALSADHRQIEDLLIVGTLRKPAAWESTAVPELRVQAAEAAENVLSYLSRDRAGKETAETKPDLNAVRS